MAEKVPDSVVRAVKASVAKEMAAMATRFFKAGLSEAQVKEVFGAMKSYIDGAVGAPGLKWPFSLTNDLPSKEAAKYVYERIVGSGPVTEEMLSAMEHALEGVRSVALKEIDCASPA
jgi:hypothetical protein